MKQQHVHAMKTVNNADITWDAACEQACSYSDSQSGLQKQQVYMCLLVHEANRGKQHS